MSLTVVITGANRGIGLGLVGEILKNDEVGKVFATTRSFAKSADLAMISDPRLTIVEMDGDSDESVKRAATQVDFLLYNYLVDAL